jgi:RNA 3'-terminal phosphate cyclase
MNGHDRNETEESRRILDRIARESDPSGSLAVRTARRVERHMRAEDADQADAIEVWGTRIGRGIGIVLLVVLAGWLLSYFAGG